MAGSPATIHSAIALPSPPAPARPWAQKPAATKKPRTSLSPSRNSLSGVKASGPLMRRVTLTSSIAGTRRRELTAISSKRSQSSSSRIAVEVGRDRVEAVGAQRPRRAVALVAAHDQAAALLAVVDEQVGVAQRGQVAVVAVAEGLGDEVLVREGHDRDAHAGHAPDLGGEHAAGVDDHLGLDRPPLGLHAAHAPRLHVDRRHARVRVDPAAALARALGQRVGQLRGVQVAVGGQVGGRAHAVGRHEREERRRLVGGQQLEREPEGPRPADLAVQLLLALGRAGQAQAAALDPPARLAQAPVELDRVHHHPRQRHAAAQLADEPGRVEGRAAGQLGAVDEHDVALAELCEVVGDRRPPHPAADDDDARALGKLTRSRQAPATPPRADRPRPARAA